MKVYHEGDKAQALCHDDGPVTVTYGYRDVPFNDGNGVAKNIMAGICDRCGQVIVIPAQSEPAISQARKRVEHSLEVNIPAAYIDILDAAVMRIATHPTTDFRKPLVVFYLDRYACQEESLDELVALHAQYQASPVFARNPRKRFSVKLSGFANERLLEVSRRSNLNKTDLIKSLVAKINDDIVLPKQPKHLSELTTIVEVLYA